MASGGVARRELTWAQADDARQIVSGPTHSTSATTGPFVDHGASGAPGTDRLILLGTLGYLPNLDGARWFVEEILPAVRERRPDARVALVGSSPPAALAGLVRPGVELVGPVEHVGRELAASDVFVAPLRAGSGVRLKLLEAFASGIPVVATSLAAEGLDVRDGVHLAIADDERTFADAVVRLLEDPALRSVRGASGLGGSQVLKMTPDVGGADPGDLRRLVHQFSTRYHRGRPG